MTAEIRERYNNIQTDHFYQIKNKTIKVSKPVKSQDWSLRNDLCQAKRAADLFNSDNKYFAMYFTILITNFSRIKPCFASEF